MMIQMNSIGIQKKRVKSLIAKAKKEYFHERFSKCNLRKWDVIKDIILNKKKTSKNLNSENHVETAEKFNIFSANVGKNVFNKNSRIETFKYTSFSSFRC